MKPLLLSTVVSLALAGFACAGSPLQAHEHALTTPAALAATTATQAEAEAAPAAPKLQAALRGLWHGHAVETRNYALAVKADDAAAADLAAHAVVDNAKAISDAVAGFYGAAAGEEMLRLLGGHWGGVKALTDANRQGDTAGASAAMDDLVANAGEIATFLAGANPNLPADAVRGLLVAHGAHHGAQTRQIMTGDMDAEAQTWVAMQAHMDVIADALAGAIAKQFPDKVS
ncbi:hypothetical protein ACW7G0_10350 [Lysobacter sp. A286]